MTDWSDPEALDCSDEDTFDALLDRAETREKGNYFEFFAEGDELSHDPGLRLSQHGSEGWMGQTLNHDPAYWRSDAARERGFDGVPVHPDYLLACVMGITVEDLSEKGGYFLGRTDVEFHRPAYPGTELAVTSRVVDTRTSSSRPTYGIVTWETEGRDRETGDRLVSYERTNMIPRREPAATDGGGSMADGDGVDPETPDLPETLLAPDGARFEDFSTALERAEAEDAAVAYRHERGRTMDDQLVAGLPLSTLNTARQHHNRDEMADSPSGDIVAYGDVTRSIALAHARSDEATYRERRFEDERFHSFVTLGDTIYGFTRVLDCDPDAGPDRAGAVTFEHVAFNQDSTPVYSGRRTALIQRQQ
ncbi:MaoC family dehydratase N-terminal domain-containing protein [Halomicroarcula limicola]|uniref:MaoC family dehydratase N-terminal domain-containing protein n=1 Tax=Haloarcula limicola TaxID=1429915 RepID=A0A8J8C7D3_9EURY|nr:2-methylfumaryl-CoA hydratase [Halomicroarcula limicola]MBV0923440.1 MaoC family dehydratase N-terminal domain-containing protein [Halomicroarcula limicola]